MTGSAGPLDASLRKHQVQRRSVRPRTLGGLRRLRSGAKVASHTPHKRWAVALLDRSRSVRGLRVPEPPARTIGVLKGSWR